MSAARYVNTAAVAAYQITNAHASCVASKYLPTTLETRKQVDESLVYYFMGPNVLEVSH